MLPFLHSERGCCNIFSRQRAGGIQASALLVYWRIAKFPTAPVQKSTSALSTSKLDMIFDVELPKPLGPV